MKTIVASLIALFFNTTTLLAQEFREEITVERLIVDAHVVDYSGNPIEGLRPIDFEVLVDGKKAVVESVESIPVTEIPAFQDGEEPQIIHRGRLIVMLFQTDFQRERAKGQIRISPHAYEFVRNLLPGDRVAVLSYDSHLKLRQDFTNEPALLETAIRDSILINEPPDTPLVYSPALKTYLGPESMRNAATPEQGLYVLAKALEQIPGPKSLLLFGWGLGVYVKGQVLMTADYFKARRALDAARTTVFSLDISDADYHSLEVGLGKVSQETGGMYAKTHQFPKLAMERVEKAIGHRYELTIKTPPVARGEHKVDVRLKKRKGTVMARTTFTVK